MKAIITFILFVLLLVQAVGQNPSAPIPPQQSAAPQGGILGTCNNPRLFCRENMPQTFGQNDGTICNNGVTKLFFSFYVVQSFVSTPTFSTGIAFGYTASGPGGNINTTFTLYGPFNQGENSCEKISTMQAPIAYQGSGSGTVNVGGISFLANKFYIVEINISSCSGLLISNFHESTSDYIQCTNDIFVETSCENCLPKFQPSVGEYVVSAWVKSGNMPLGTTTYPEPKIKINAGPLPSNPGGPNFTQTFGTSGNIIDGWQKIEEKFFVTDETSFELILTSSGTHPSYFDDIRIYPNDGSAITYVYDPLTLRLMAELDERNYATLYEYDEEGQLVRIKKETEKGIMTIQENRENNGLK